LQLHRLSCKDCQDRLPIFEAEAGPEAAAEDTEIQIKLEAAGSATGDTGLIRVNIMITFKCDFLQFSEKIGVFLKKQCYDQIFAYII
jgi:hypothetical protein